MLNIIPVNIRQGNKTVPFGIIFSIKMKSSQLDKINLQFSNLLQINI